MDVLAYQIFTLMAVWNMMLCIVQAAIHLQTTQSPGRKQIDGYDGIFRYIHCLESSHLWLGGDGLELDFVARLVFKEESNSYANVKTVSKERP